MEMIAIIVLAVLAGLFLGLFLWERQQGRQRWQEQGDKLSRIVGERMDGTIRVFGEVQRELGILAQRTREIQEVGRGINNLQELLRAPKFRGGFGELLLEKLLAEVLPQDSYSLQYRFRSGEIVDAVVRIGRNLVPIDSKFPLEDFERITCAENDEEQNNLRRQFNRNIRKHVDNVAKYILPDEDTFDFALMYIPAENIYYETIIRDTEESDLFSYSVGKKVIPVSPNSFYAYLQVIVQGLKGLHFEKAAGEILTYVKRLQNDLGDFKQDYDVVGTHIRHAANKYDEASRKLARFDDKLQLADEAHGRELPNSSAGMPDDVLEDE